MSREPAHGISKRGRLGEGRPTKRTPEMVAKIAEVIAMGLTDEEAALLAGVNPDTMTEWRKDPGVSGASRHRRAEARLQRAARSRRSLHRELRRARHSAVKKELHRVAMDSAQFAALAKRLASQLKTTKKALGAYDDEEKDSQQQSFAGAGVEDTDPWPEPVVLSADSDGFAK